MFFTMEKMLDYFKQNKTQTLTVFLIVLFGLILRLFALFNFGTIWYDELFSWYFANQNSVIDTLIKAVKEDIHMPLYFILLHFHLKLFGDDINTMRVLSFILSAPFIPLGFYVSKKLFNSACAYFCAIFFAINTYSIYYCLEIRFYSIILVLSLLFAYGFISILEQNKKFFYILFGALLLYSFTITPLLIFIFFIVGFIYLLIYKKSLKEYLKANFILFLISFPAIFQVIYNALALHSSLTYYPRDYFEFNPYIIYDILENFFSLYNIQLWQNNYTLYHNIFEDMNIAYFLAVFVPVAIALFGLISAIFSKNKRFYLIFLPSILFILIMLLLSYNKQAVIQTRYLTIVFPIVIMCFCFGISSLSKKVKYTLYFTFILCNLFAFIFYPTNVISLHREELSNLSNKFSEINIKDDDIIFAPMMGERILFYSKRGFYIPFTIEDAFVLKDKEALRFYLGENYYYFNYDNIKDFLYPYILKDIPVETYEKNLNDYYLSKFKKGQRVIFISLIYDFALSNSHIAQNYSNYSEISNSAILTLKPMRDSLLILQKYLKQTHYEVTSDGIGFYIFEK